MKIRNGFVSNSSSSSFILKFNETFPDTTSIAKSMLKNKFDEWLDYGDVEENDPFMIKVYKNLEKFKNQHYDPYTPMFFKSCNYDTYIVPITKDYVFIDTCNNTNWDIQYDNNIVNKIPDEVIEKYPNSEGYSGNELYIVRGDTKDEEEDDYDIEGSSIKYNTEYYLVEDGVFMSSPNGYKTCKKSGCYADIWVLKGVEYCMICDHDKLMRGLKLKKIRNAFI